MTVARPALVVPTLPRDGRRDEHGMRQGWFHFRSESGELVGVAHYRDDLLNGQVLTFANGHCVAELSYRDGLLDGPFRRVVSPGTYAIEDAVSEEGAYVRGVPTGTFRLRDERGGVLAARCFGDAPHDDETLRSCLRGGLTRASDWGHRAAALIAKKRVAEGIASLARAVGAGTYPETLRATIQRVAAPVTEAEGIARAEFVLGSSSARVLLGGLLRGGEPTRILRRMAVLARGDASFAFMYASLALREWPLSPIAARALRELRDGDAEAALADARLLLLSHEADARAIRTLAARIAREEAAEDEEIYQTKNGDRPTVRRRPSHIAASELAAAM